MNDTIVPPIHRIRRILVRNLIMSILAVRSSAASTLEAVEIADDPETASIGTAQIVLPGFTPLSWENGRLSMGAGRAYQWGQQLLPTSIEARDQQLTGPLTLRLRLDGQLQPLPPLTLSVITATDHHIELNGNVAVSDVLRVSAAIRVEYDGLATVELHLIPRGVVAIDGLELSVPLMRSANLRLMAYAPESIYDYRKQVVFPLCGEMPYKSVLGLTDTERSFLDSHRRTGLPGPGQRTPANEFEMQRATGSGRPTADTGAGAYGTVDFAICFSGHSGTRCPSYRPSGSCGAERNREEAFLGNRQLWWVDAFPALRPSIC